VERLENANFQYYEITINKFIIYSYKLAWRHFAWAHPWTTRPRLDILKIKSAFLRIAIVIFHCDFSSRLLQMESILYGKSPSAQLLSISPFPIISPSRFNHYLSPLQLQYNDRCWSNELLKLPKSDH